MATGQEVRRAGLLLIDAAVVAAGTAVGLLLQVDVWLAVPVGLAAYVGLYLAAAAVLHGRGHRDSP
jgi:hypothetical protein